MEGYDGKEFVTEEVKKKEEASDRTLGNKVRKIMSTPNSLV